ncbi:hypothetical protein Tco_1428171 [Tanacetum coccineum]
MLRTRSGRSCSRGMAMLPRFAKIYNEWIVMMPLKDQWRVNKFEGDAQFEGDAVSLVEAESSPKEDIRILVLDATKGTEVSNPTDLPTRGPSSPGYPLRVILTLFAPHVDVDTMIVSTCCWTCFQMCQAGHLQRELQRRTLVLVSTGHADKNHTHQPCFALTQESAPILQDVFPEELRGIPPIRDVEFNISLFSELSQSPKLLIAWHRLVKRVEDLLQEFGAEVLFRPIVSPWGALFLFVQEGRYNEIMSRQPVN